VENDVVAVTGAYPISTANAGDDKMGVNVPYAFCRTRASRLATVDTGIRFGVPGKGEYTAVYTRRSRIKNNRTFLTGTPYVLPGKLIEERVF